MWINGITPFIQLSNLKKKTPLPVSFCEAFHRFLAALAALYLTLVSDSVGATLEF